MVTTLPYEIFHEIWWIYAPERHPWGGLRLAHFRKTVDDTLVVIITGETDKRRIGLRIWDDIAPREGWVKVAQIAIPTPQDVAVAVDKQLREIAAEVVRDG